MADAIIDVDLVDETEAVTLDLDDVVPAGGGGGTNDYNKLIHIPSINGVQLKGNKTLSDLGIDSAINTEVENYVAEHKEELKGDPGAPGKDGDDGFSPVASVSQTMGGAVVTITDKNGTTTATIKNGTDGKTPQKGIDYEDGKPGEDGYSPAASIQQTSTGAVITIVDKSGQSSATISNGKNGNDGYTPVKGKDYFDGKDGKDYVITSADYDAIATVVVGKLPKYNGGVQ